LLPVHEVNPEDTGGKESEKNRYPANGWSNTAVDAPMSWYIQNLFFFEYLIRIGKMNIETAKAVINEPVILTIDTDIA
jgi:hypothetical protein